MKNTRFLQTWWALLLATKNAFMVKRLSPAVLCVPWGCLNVRVSLAVPFSCTKSRLPLKWCTSHRSFPKNFLIWTVGLIPSFRHGVPIIPLTILACLGPFGGRLPRTRWSPLFLDEEGFDKLTSILQRLPRTAAWVCWSKGKAEQQQPQRTVGWEAILAAHALAWLF